MDLLSAVFLGCFVFGFAAVLVSFLSGAVHGGLGEHFGSPGHLHGPTHGLGDAHLGAGHAHFGAHADAGAPAGGHAHAGTHEAGAHAGESWFQVNPTTLLTFLTWFGGAGFILHNYAHVVAWVSLGVAALVGLGGALLVSLLLLRVVLPHQTELRAGENDPVGSVGRICAPIRAGGIGEVVYVRGGTRRTVGARAADGRALERGAEVVITRFERGVASVEPWQEFVSRDRSLAVEKSE